MIHRSAKFNKSMDNLRKSGGKATLAARRAEEIIEVLKSKPDGVHQFHNRLTKHGELRIDRCIKYDLGGAYRLVGVRKGRNLVFTCVGTHDDCDRWIENNRGHVPATKLGEPSPRPVVQADTSADETIEPQADYDSLLLDQIDEKLLRRIFNGICRP